MHGAGAGAKSDAHRTCSREEIYMVISNSHKLLEQLTCQVHVLGCSPERGEDFRLQAVSYGQEAEDSTTRIVDQHHCHCWLQVTCTNSCAVRTSALKSYQHTQIFSMVLYEQAIGVATVTPGKRCLPRCMVYV